MNEDDTGQKYVDNAACYGVPCPKNLVQHKKYDEPPTRLGLPWEGHDNKEYDEIMDLHTRRYKDMATGKYKTGQEMYDAEREEAAAKKAAEERKAFKAPADIMESDWTGEKYVTTHRCFGEPCKEDEKK